MKIPESILLLGLCILHSASAAFQAGSAKVDLDFPIGVPLAGYGDRRTKFWPVPNFGNYTTFMEPSIGIYDTIWTKALVIDDGTVKHVFATIDAIGADGSAADRAYEIAVSKGLQGVPREHFTLHGSHSHSAPGAVSPEFLWAIAPATDLMIPELQQQLCEKIAEAVLNADKAMIPAVLATGTGQLTGVTRNRRADISPYVTPDSIDPNLGIIRVDGAGDGKPIATVWNYAIHGTCFGADNLKMSAEVMGSVNTWVEDNVGGTSLFINADAGDVAPLGDPTCTGMPNFGGGPIIGQKVKDVRGSLTPSAQVSIKVASKIVPFGRTDMNLTLERTANCSEGGPLDICSICKILQCDLHTPVPTSWVEENPRFTAIRLDIGATKTIITTIPGEALTELGSYIRNDCKAAGYDVIFLAGYSNNHMGYFAPEDEYCVGGYESNLTFWGVHTADMVRDGCKSVVSELSS